MARPNFDLSEYQNSEYTNYLSRWNGCADLSPSFFENSVSYLEKEKRLYLEVSPVYEFECMFDLYEDLEYPIPTAYQREVTEAEVESWRAELQIVREKFGSAFQVQPPNPLYPYDSTEQRINALSGTTVVVPLGEGILNFCYANFRSAYEHCASAYQVLTKTADAPKKIRCTEEGVIHLYELYAEVFPTLSEVFYSSIYTAAFPPQFTRKTKQASITNTISCSCSQSSWSSSSSVWTKATDQKSLVSCTHRSATVSGAKPKAFHLIISGRKPFNRIPATPVAQKCPLELTLIK